MEKRMTYEEFTYRIGEPITDEYGKSPIMPVFELLQGKWKMQTLYAIMCLTEARFGQIQSFCDGITPAALSSTLKDLENLGLVKKDVSGPRETSYRLTDQGEDLMPAFYELMNWGFYYKPKDKRKKKSK